MKKWLKNLISSIRQKLKAQTSDQDIFDKVVNHLRYQGQKSWVNKEAAKKLFDIDTKEKALCVYRSPGGKRCAAGILIPDDQYSSSMEGMIFEQVLNKYPQIDNDGSLKENLGLITELQSIHDTDSCVEWESRFKLLADKYDLKYKEAV